MERFQRANICYLRETGFRPGCPDHRMFSSTKRDTFVQHLHALTADVPASRLHMPTIKT